MIHLSVHRRIIVGLAVIAVGVAVGLAAYGVVPALQPGAQFSGTSAPGAHTFRPDPTGMTPSEVEQEYCLSCHAASEMDAEHGLHWPELGLSCPDCHGPAGTDAHAAIDAPDCQQCHGAGPTGMATATPTPTPTATPTPSP